MARIVKIRQLVCPDCGAVMRLKYPAHGPAFYSCVRFPSCRGSHLAHADGSPVGVPADARTRQARSQAHKAADSLWQNGRRTRDEAYALVTRLVGYPAHMGSLDFDQCVSVLMAVEEYVRDHPEEKVEGERP